MQHCAQLESCTVSLEIAARNVACNCCRSRVGSYFCNITATVSPCVHHLQHCMQLRNGMLCAMLHRVSTLEIVACNVACNCCRSRIGFYFWNVTATVSPCVHLLQHCVELRDAMLRAVLLRVSAPLVGCKRMTEGGASIYYKFKGQPKNIVSHRGLPFQFFVGSLLSLTQKW